MLIDKNFSPIMEQVFSGRRLTRVEMGAIAESIIDSVMSDVRVAAVLTGLRFTPLTSELMMGALECVLSKSERLNYPQFSSMVDCSGTGGDNLATVNISTMAAVVAAAAGAHVAKFGSRSVTSRCGSADVLEAMGVKLAQNVNDVNADFNAAGLSFLYSPSFYPALKHLSAVRKSIGFHTIFDVLIPLANPVNITGQLLGVYSPDLIPIVAQCLLELGRRRALVVHSVEGLDEISVCGPTHVAKIAKGTITNEIWNPSDFGINVSPIDSLKGAGTEENARIFKETLSAKEFGPIFDAVTLNAAATLWCAELCDDVRVGLEICRAVVKSGGALRKLEEWQNGRRA